MKLQYRNNIKYDYLFRFLSSFDLSSAIWVLYLVQKGLPLWQIGLLEGIFHVVSFLSEIPTGAAADLLGRKKVMVLSRVCHAISAVIMLFSSGFWEFAIGFAFSAWGYNLISGSEEALVYDSLKLIKKEESYLKVSSHLEVILNIAQGMATLVGGILAQQSFIYCYAAAFVISLLSLLPCLLLKEPKLCENVIIDQNDIKKNDIKKNDSNRGLFLKQFQNSYTIVRTNPKVIEILISYSLIFTFYMITYFYGQKYFSELGLNKVQISMVMSVTMIADCIGAMSCIYVEKVLKKDTKLYVTLVIGLGMLFLTVGNLPLSIICFAIMGFANTLLYPIQSNALNCLIPSQQRATILSVNSMAYSLFMLVLFPIVGGIADKIGLKTTFIGLGLSVILLAMSFIFIKFQTLFTK